MPVPLTPQEIDRWHRVLAAAAKLQSAIPEAFLVGGTAVGIYAPYRTSRDADHLVPALPQYCAEVLARLEALAGWSTEDVRGQHTILGRMDGIEATLMDDGRVRQRVPLEVQTYRLQGLTLRLPTLFEILRIKSYLLLFRNMARDYADCHALSDELEDPELFQALTPLEQRYRMRPHAAWSHDGHTETPVIPIRDGPTSVSPGTTRPEEDAQSLGSAVSPAPSGGFAELDHSRCPVSGYWAAEFWKSIEYEPHPPPNRNWPLATV